MKRLVMILAALAASAAAPALGSPEPESVMCTIVEPLADGAVFVSEAFKLPNPDDDFSLKVMSKAFEAFVRQRYSFESSRKLLNFLCTRLEDKAIEQYRAEKYRRQGNKPDGKLIQTTVAWTPDRATLDASREQRKIDKEAIAKDKAAGIQGYMYCVSTVRKGDSAYELAFSGEMTVPLTASFKDFSAFVAKKFREERKSDDVSCNHGAETSDELAFLRGIQLQQTQAPPLGDSIGGPHRRGAFTYSTVWTSWKLSDAGYREFADTLAKAAEKKRKINMVLESASNARRRRDCMAGNQAACGPR